MADASELSAQDSASQQQADTSLTVSDTTTVENSFATMPIAEEKMVVATGSAAVDDHGHNASVNFLTLPANINLSLLPIVGTRPPPRPLPSSHSKMLMHLEKPNPWKFLEAYKNPYFDINEASTGKSAAPSMTFPQGSFPLTKFPLEVIYCIAKTLPLESAACLALVNKTFYGLLRPRVVFKKKWFSLWKLLVLLERDAVHFIACPECMELHHPFLRWGGTSDEPPALCEGLPYLLFLPYGVKYATVRAIAKAHLENRSYSEVLTYTNRFSMAFDDQRRSVKTTNCRMIQGNLLMREETIFHIGGDAVTPRSLFKLHLTLETTFPGQSVCAHKRWQDGQPSLHVVDLDKLADQHDDAHHNEISPFTEIEHAEECFSSKNIQEVLKRKNLRKTVSSSLFAALFHEKKHNIMGKVHGCKECFTDYSITHIDLEDVGRCIILTVWKDLGGVGRHQAYKWETHVQDAEYDFGPQGMKYRGPDRLDDIGDIYCAWEGIDASTFDRKSHTYEPEIPKRVIKEFTKAKEDDNDNSGTTEDEDDF